VTDEIAMMRAAMRDMNIKALARKTGLSPHTLYRFMQGNHTSNVGTIAALKAYFQSVQLKGVAA
jgi:hypothetical protein